MPLIQELPPSKHDTKKPGWAYVPDTGIDPSKAPIVPTGSRATGKRATRGVNVGSGEGDQTSARQRARIAQHLASLERENHRDVQIVVPGRAKDVGQRGLRNTMTPGVKRILNSQKTFSNHLADEEAALAHQATEPTIVGANQSKAAGKGAQTKTRAKRMSESRVESSADPMDVDAQPGLTTKVSGSPDKDMTAATQKEPGDPDPLLKVDVPSLPTQSEIEELLSAPPLSYNQAAAAPTASTAPARQFCSICGFWGRARCMKCGIRICGMECKNVHEETNCSRFWL